MEETQVVIVGGGPSGLALGLSLAKFRIHSVILEKETEVAQDPRGVYLTGDAVRIMHHLGIGDEMPSIGHVVPYVHFHHTSFSTKPFFSLDLGSANSFHQALPEGVLQIQPRLESALRQAIEKSKWSTLRTGCTVIQRPSEDPPVVEYHDEQGARHQIRGQWLVGADGKLGVVRKHFLEPTANIKQQDGVYPYAGTWIAANLKITTPTPQSHPEFPLWRLGYSPADVYDLFWPKGWHFCSPPGKPTACGRFGPHSEGLWRHEFRQDELDDDSKDSEALLWEHITPMITREKDEGRGGGQKFAHPVQYPRDCIAILRCRLFRFVHKVVDRWFHKRTILIGDAAHVFPPFAGQGIASGVRDAHQLAWRLALLLARGSSSSSAADDVTTEESVLGAWALERRQSVDSAARNSMINGQICNHKPSFWLLALLRMQQLLSCLPVLRRLADPQARIEVRGFTGVKGGFFAQGYNGGARLAQIHVQSPAKEIPFLSDGLLEHPESIFTLLVISNGDDHHQMQLYERAKAAILAASISPAIISEDAIVVYNPRVSGSARAPSPNVSRLANAFSPGPQSRPQMIAPTPGEDNSTYIDRLGRSTKFAIVRPDFFVFACARDVSGLVTCLGLLKERVGQGKDQL